MIHRQLSLLRQLILILVIGCLLTACQADNDTVGQTTPTVWPTLAPVLTSMAEAGSPQSEATTSGPVLLDKFRVDLVDGSTSIFPLEGQLDKPVRIEVIVLQGELDPIIQINDALGHRLALADAGGPGEPEVIGQLQFPGDAYYELGIGAESGSGQLGVSIYQLDSGGLEGGGLLNSINEEVEGNIAQPASYHIFRLEAQRGERFDIAVEAQTEGLDLAFDLYGPDGTLLVTRDDEAGKDPALWNFMPHESGTYIIALHNFDEHTGDYELRVTPSEGAGPVVIGVRTELELGVAPQNSTWLTLNARSLDVLRVEARSLTPGVDLSVAVYDEYGNALITANDGSVGEAETLSFIQLPFDGNYQVEFKTLGDGGTIQYLILTTRSANEDLGGRVALNNFAKDGDMVETGTLITYIFDLNAGDLLSIAARAVGAGNPLDLGFDVYGPDGVLIASHDDDVDKNPVADRIEVPLTGRYVVTLWNYRGTIGPFEIVIDNPAAPSTLPH
jgi:hypothetical protein